MGTELVGQVRAQVSRKGHRSAFTSRRATVSRRKTPQGVWRRVALGGSLRDPSPLALLTDAPHDPTARLNVGRFCGGPSVPCEASHAGLKP